MDEPTLSPEEQRLAEVYDAFHTARASSPLSARLYALAMGEDYPPEVNASSSCDWQLLATAVRQLRLHPGQHLVDLGCGTGGEGLWLARALAARLTGIDVSSVAVRLAATRADHFVPKGRADFRVGTLASTGLPNSSADGVICVDAYGFAPDARAAIDEVHRILTPGARAVITFSGQAPLSSRPWTYQGLELEAEEHRPGVGRMWLRLYELRAEHEAELRRDFGDDHAQGMLDEAQRRTPDMSSRHFSVVTLRRTTD
ncbi:class I SAM-dependent methyltransferase [Streptomyces halobius]|uniref:Class I SAM-dependent methyltransferase n=1 Tax=Streptomyces halobius TaxID=2879846 RepID=A0ABY4MJU1_9ACTN|nr:class I SAM-dependent methyltransferase [Streptomyces halobius]UQA97472.1 class I SAM-dependent methyltransferase [Streptomyces halobius]